MMDSQYGLRPFYAGAVLRGIRAFSADQAGRLYGVTFTVPWLSGENIKRCLAPEGPCGVDAATTFCTCGFYAITENTNNEYMRGPYGRPPLVEGVIEGYGQVVVGSKGFRAEKARIVALVVPPHRDGAPVLPSWFDLTLNEQDRRRIACERHREPDHLRGFSHLTANFNDFDVKHKWQILMDAWRAGCSCLDGLAEKAMQLVTLGGSVGRFNLVPRAAIIDRYRVPIFETLNDALKEFPIIGQKDIRPPATDNALAPGAVATNVDPDRPDLGAL